MDENHSSRVLHSVLSTEAIAAFFEEQYAYGAASACTLVRSYVNEVYWLPSQDNGTFIFKVFRRDWRNETDAAWEVDIQRHLLASGIPVSEPLALRDGSYVAGVNAPEGCRAGVLFAELTGAKPVHPFTDDLYFGHGASLAGFHTTLDSLPPSEKARLYDASFLIVRSESIILGSPEIATSAPHCSIVRDLADQLNDRLRKIGPGTDWGICHGDPTMDNVHVLPDGRHAFFDFDLSGYSWRALDLSGIYLWARREAGARAFWGAFLKGYRSRRDLSESDIALLPVVAAAWEMWDLGHELEHWRRWSGSWRMTPVQLRERIELLARWDEIPRTWSLTFFDAT